ncbi:MAG TPA: hypothetical protein VF546_18320 [Pyrinomonadaceae bacterium]|jgi:hypothetical protein
MKKELTGSLAQLLALIVVMIALAVWTTALSLWASSGAAAQSELDRPAPAETLTVASTQQ